MANKDLFRSERGSVVPAADAVNNAGGKAYTRSAKESLAQYVCTGCLNGTYYTSAKSQLDEVSKLLTQVEPEFIGKLAVYAHEKSLMKDLPALLVAYLASDNGAGGGLTTPEQLEKLNILRRTFPRVIKNGSMLRNFFQMIRAATFGRKSFGYVPRALMRGWFESNSPSWIFSQSIGNSPSLADVIKLVKPKPNTPEKAALFAYLLNAEVIEGVESKILVRRFLDKKDNQVKYAAQQPYENLPSIVKEFEEWKKDRTRPVPAVNFRFLDNEKLTMEQWADIASKANWITTLKNLNAYAKHGVFNFERMTDLIANRLSDEQEVRKSKVFPYQIMMAFLATASNSEEIPSKVRNALQDAMEIACQNVPVLGKVKLFPDVSGSMSSPVTGNRGAATSKVRCIDVAALFSVAMVRSNQDAEIIPFETDVVRLELNPRDSIMTNAKKLAGVGGGGTNCSAPLALLNNRGNSAADVLIYISDNESWADRGYNRGTGMMTEWVKYKEKNPNAKLVCIDLTPSNFSQVKEQPDILRVGGFSDNVFGVIARFIEGGWHKDFWVREIEEVVL